MRHVGEAIGEEEEAEISQFQRLPDDIVLIIFDKVSNVKWLCRCSMVSKRFFSLVPLVQTVSTRIFMPCKPVNNGLLGKFSKFLSNMVLKPLRYFHKLALSPPLQSHDPPRLMFLCSLKQTRFLNFEFVSGFNAINDSVFQWGCQFNTKQASVTFLIATSLSKIMEPEEESEEEELGPRFYYSAMWVGLWLHALCDVVTRHPMLQSITISDLINKGVPERCLGGEKLVECRNAVALAEESWAKRNVRVGCVPVLQLPRSGYVMKHATIMNYKMYGDDYEVDSAVLDAFAEEEGVFLEAVEQILEHHRECIKPRFANQN
ncbi:hypothetical protein Vadar_031529 [Vaccinium darrowii]|uniref:Uncharacterized protein n=1 Tax=Vaccinium darrowii TaxID=229202 RepID=A0ACB7Z9W6_9ERIC|nr:hypothetical protein Vadar_031529 [Vaccinium darrowii]